VRRAGVLALLLFETASVWAADIEAGRRLYEHGIAADGSPLRATTLGQADLVGDAAACATCHRRSGMGSREGEIVIPPITGPALLSTPQPQVQPRRRGSALPVRAERRAAYDSATLSRAIQHGIDSSGQRLADLMPRYSINDDDLDNLLAYLQQLAATTELGVFPGGLRLATIVTPEVQPQRARIVEDTVGAWAVRGGPSNLAIALDVWRLTGPPEKWLEQLNSLYRQNPPFAIVTGIGRGHWAPVADFCEQQELPCLFPLIDSAPNEERYHYSVYLDSGLPLESRLLASHFRQSGLASSRILQFVADPTGERAAQSVASALACQTCVTRRWEASHPGDTTADIGERDIVVAWLERPALDSLLAAMPQLPASIFVSARLAPPEAVSVPDAMQPRLRWVSSRVEPRRMAAANAVWLRPWLAQMHLPESDESLRAEVYAATFFFGDALARMRGNWNREYLLETIEGGMFGRPAGQIYYGLSLAPGQRVAAKAGHILGFLPPDFKQIGPVSVRLTPDR
jgi:hypothetical protein